MPSTWLVQQSYLPARSFPEVCHWRELCNDGPSIIVAVLQGLQCKCCICLIFELDVHVAYHVVCEIVANVQILDLAELC